MTGTPLDLVEAFLPRFIAYPSDPARVAHTLWIAHTYLLEKFDTTPRLAFMSAEKMSGKTRAVLEVTPLLVHHPIPSVNASAAVILRLADQYGGTILYDEIDAIFGNVKNQEANADLCSLMNAGYRRGAKVRRWNVNRNAPDEFNAFAPLAVAGLRTLPDTLASRAIFIRMKRRGPNEKIESFRWRNASKAAEPIKCKLQEWCVEIADKINLETDHPRCPPASKTVTPTSASRCWLLPMPPGASGPSGRGTASGRPSWSTNSAPATSRRGRSCATARASMTERSPSAWSNKASSRGPSASVSPTARATWPRTSRTPGSAICRPPGGAGQAGQAGQY